MTYRVCYIDGWAPAGAARSESVPEREEYFLSERDALRRAGEVIRAGVHRRITLIDNAGKELSGIALDLKLGVTVD